MSNFINVNELVYTPEELEYIKNEMKKYKVPWLYKIVFGSLYKWGTIFMPLLFLIIFILAMIHNSTNIDLWNVIKGLSFFWIFFIGGLVAISWFMHRIKVLKWCKRLRITIQQWNAFSIIFHITYV